MGQKLWSFGERGPHGAFFRRNSKLQTKSPMSEKRRKSFSYSPLSVCRAMRKADDGSRPLGGQKLYKPWGLLPRGRHAHKISCTRRRLI